MASRAVAPLPIGEDLLFIERGVLNSNLIIFKGASPVVIDTGYVSDAGQTLELLRSCGIDPQRVALLIGTHTHADHIGGHEMIQRLSGCVAALHKIGKGYIDQRDGTGTWTNYFHHKCDYFECGRSLEDGEEIAIGPYSFQVMHLPGHAADCIALYNPREKILLSGDTLLELSPPILMRRLEGEDVLDVTMQSLDRLESLDVRIVYPGHGPPFADKDLAVQRARSRVMKYREDIEDWGRVVMRSMLVFKLAALGDMTREAFWTRIAAAPWFAETAALHFGAGGDRAVFDAIVDKLIGGKLVTMRGQRLCLNVPR